MNLSLRNSSLTHTQMFRTYHMAFYTGGGLSHDRRVTWQELEKNGGDFLASVSVEGIGSLVDVEGFSDLSREPLFIHHQDLGVIQCVTMTGGRSTFRDGRVGVFSIIKVHVIWLKHLGMFQIVNPPNYLYCIWCVITIQSAYIVLSTSICPLY